MKVIDIIIPHHDLLEGVGKGIFSGIAERELKFIEKYSAQYAKMYQDAVDKGFAPPTTRDFLQKEHGVDGKTLIDSEFLKDPAVRNKFESAVAERIKDIKKGKAVDVDKLKPINKGGVLEKAVVSTKFIYNWGLVTLWIGAIEEPIRVWMSQCATANYYLSRRVTPEGAKKQDKDPKYRDTPQELKRYWTLANEEYYRTFITTMTGNIIALLPATAIRSASYMSNGSVIWSGIIKLLPGLGKMMDNKILKYLTTPAKGVTAAALSAFQIELLWELNEAPGISGVDSRGIANLSDAVWIRVLEHAKSNTEWGIWEGPALALEYLGPAAMRSGTAVTNVIGHALEMILNNPVIEKMVDTIKNLPIFEPSMKDIDIEIQKGNKPPEPTPSPSPGPSPTPPGPTTTEKYPKRPVGYINAAGWEVQSIGTDGTRWWFKVGEKLFAQEADANGNLTQPEPD